MRHDLHILGSYVPAMLVRHALQHPEPPTAPRLERFPAAVLFADVSGFTALTERLATRGAAGAEDLVHLLNAYFGQLIDLVTSYGGDVVKFAGDAVLALWRADTAADLPAHVQQIAQCCTVAQARLHNYAVAADVHLSMKLAIGAGEVVLETLGGVFGRWEYLVAGAPLAQVGAANHHASPGQIYLSPEAWALTQGQGQGCPEPDGSVRLETMQTPVALPPATPPVPTPEAVGALRTFLPGAIRTRLDAGQTDWLAELRHVTVLFINLPDFTADTPLAQAQEAMAALQTHLYRYEGSINKISVDDKGASLVAALGLPPLAHEDDSLRGLRAALAMQAALQQLGMRSAIGVTTGQAFCGTIGNTVRREYTLMGDVVNLSARLMQAAPGTILCDEPTAAAAMGRLALTALEPIHVKGKQAPIAIYRPERETRTTPAAPRPRRQHTPLVGRVHERAWLTAALTGLLTERHSSHLVLQGEAGMGKSRLMDELVTQAQAQGAVTLTGAGDAIERSTPYYPWRRLVAQLFQLAEGPDDPAMQRTQVLHHLPADPQITAMAPLLGAMLPFEWPDNATTGHLRGKARAEQTHTLLVRILHAVVQRQPLVLALEDLHWRDSGSLALTLAVCQQVQPLLLVASTRPMPEPLPAEYAALLQAPDTRVVVLEDMPATDVLDLVCQRLGVDRLPEQAARVLRDKAEGNPFFSEELALAMRDMGWLEIADGHCRVSPAAPAHPTWNLPTTIQGVITSRIDRLAPAEQMTMKVASVIGREFPYRTLHAVHPIQDGKEALLGHFDTLLALDLTPVARPAPDLAYLFKHAITHEVAYNLLLFAQRRQLHRAVAEWHEHTYASNLAPYYPVLAYHWSKAAEDRVPEPSLVWTAVEYLHKAGDQAAQQYLNQEAIQCFTDALRLLASVPASAERDQRELQLQLALGAPLLETRGYAAAEVAQTYARAKVLSQQIGDDQLLFPALRGLWAYDIGRADYHEAQTLGEQMLDLAERQHDPTIRLEAHRALGNTVFWMGQFDAAHTHMQAGIALYAPEAHSRLALLYGQDPDVANRGMQAWPLALMGHAAQAIQRGQEAIALATRLGHPYSLGYALVHDMCCWQYLRCVSEASERAEQAMALATEHSFPNWLLAGMAVKGWALAQQGQHEAGIAQLQQVLGLWRGSGAELVVPYFLTLLAEAYQQAGNMLAAVQALHDALAVGAAHDEHWYEAEIKRQIGVCLLAQGDQAGIPWMQEALALAQKQQAGLLVLRAATSLCRAWRGTDRFSEAKHVLASVYAGLSAGQQQPDWREAQALLAG